MNTRAISLAAAVIATCGALGQVDGWPGDVDGDEFIRDNVEYFKAVATDIDDAKHEISVANRYYHPFYRGNQRYTKIDLPIGLTEVRTLRISSWTNLTSLVIPPGMFSLETVRVDGCTSLTNLVIQQDTGIEKWGTGNGLGVFCEGAPLKRVSIPKRMVSLKELETNGWAGISFFGMYEKTRSAGGYYMGRIHLAVILAGFVEFDIRDDGMEIVRYRGTHQLCWGHGAFEGSSSINGPWWPVSTTEQRRRGYQHFRYKQWPPIPVVLPRPNYEAPDVYDEEHYTLEDFLPPKQQFYRVNTKENRGMFWYQQ